MPELFNSELEPEILTTKDKTKTIPCRKCRRPCVVTRFASAAKVECTACHNGQVRDTTADATVQPKQIYFNTELEPEILTDKDETKTVPCRRCHRPCVVTVFASAEKVECSTCRGVEKQEKREATLVARAASVNPALLEHLADGILNPVFKTIPLCPFDPDHHVELKHVCHNDHYGPRHFKGIEKGLPIYEQETGEVVTYQCNDCKCVISFSTMNPLLMQAQNETRHVNHQGPSTLETMLGVRTAA